MNTYALHMQTKVESYTKWGKQGLDIAFGFRFLNVQMSCVCSHEPDLPRSSQKGRIRVHAVMDE